MDIYTLRICVEVTGDLLYYRLCRHTCDEETKQERDSVSVVILHVFFSFSIE